MGDNPTYIPITPTAELLAADRYARPGTRVRIAWGLNEGDEGTVTGYARGQKAHAQFEANKEAAHDSGRNLVSDDYECLIDGEGPLVTMDDGRIEWFPGQAEGVLELVPDDQITIRLKASSLTTILGHLTGDDRPIADEIRRQFSDKAGAV